MRDGKPPTPLSFAERSRQEILTGLDHGIRSSGHASCWNSIHRLDVSGGFVAQACDVRWQENAAGLVARLGALALLSLLGTAAYRHFIAIRGAGSHSRQWQSHRPCERRLDKPRVRV